MSDLSSNQPIEVGKQSHEEVLQKTVGVGARLDYLLGIIREGFKNDDMNKVKTYIEKADVELSKGGDWERKNKLAVYKGLFATTQRSFVEASNLFIKSLATFTPCDLLTFRDFVFYTIITSLIAQDRSILRSKILESPEILAAIGEIPHLREFVLALHECRYAQFFMEFVDLIDEIRNDRYLVKHIKYITRTTRLIAYRQFLLSYKSVTVEMMAQTFGVSTDFIEADLYEFISSGKLNCKMDRVNKYIESNRLDDPRNALYSKIVKQGDSLLNRIQKLSRVIDV
jgi:26S proteasome regulatory subunit N7